MAGDDRKAKASPVTKSDAAATKKSEAPATEKGTPDGASKAESGDKPAASPSSFNRGEGQKPVTQAYKDNWNAIFGKRKKR